MNPHSDPIAPEPISRRIRRRLTWSNLRRAALATFVLALVVVFCWPRSGFTVRLVTLSGILGAGAALICGLTYWHKARVQIGRRGERYKAVRWTAGLAAAFNLSFLLVWILSTSMAGRRSEESGQVIDDSGQKVWVISLKSSLPVAIAHLQGDDRHQIEDALARGLETSGAKLPIRIIRVDQTFKPNSGVAKDFNTQDVVYSLPKHGAYVMFWGGVDRAAGITHLYETGVIPRAQFGDTFVTSYFKLPELPIEELAPVLWLVLFEQSRGIKPINKGVEAAALIAPLKEVDQLVEANVKNTAWSADTRARMNFILGRLSDLQGELAGDDKPLRISIVDYLSALADWAGPDHALDRAMTLRCLAECLGGLTLIEHDMAVYEAAERAYRSAITLYNAAGDRLDEAQNQMMLGGLLTAKALLDNNKEAIEATEAYKAALKVFDRESYPRQWAQAQYGMAFNLANLGLHGAGPQGLRDAVAIFNDVLLVRTRAQMPHEWAVTQMALGEVFEKLGEQEPGGSYFAEAVTAEKSALEELKPDEDPDNWAEAEGDLGAALSGVGQRDNSIDEFKQAIAAMREGATAKFRQRDPHTWLRIQSVLVMTLDQLGQLEWRQESLDESNWREMDRRAEEHLEETVLTARGSLGEAAKYGPPSTWAYLQSKLGDSLGAIGERESLNNKDGATEHLQEAIGADRAALSVMTMANDPENWADTENSLGDALQDLGKRESSAAYLEQAIASYQRAAKVQTIDRDPESWAATQNSIASTYEALGTRETGVAGTMHLQQATSYYQAALKVTKPDRDPMNWLVNQHNLARAETELGSREPGVDHLQQAASDYREELKYLSPDRSPTEWKEANKNLNQVLELLHQRGATG